jgi:hypothetical protein
MISNFGFRISDFFSVFQYFGAWASANSELPSALPGKAGGRAEIQNSKFKIQKLGPVAP